MSEVRKVVMLTSAKEEIKVKIEEQHQLSANGLYG